MKNDKMLGGTGCVIILQRSEWDSPSVPRVYYPALNVLASPVDRHKLNSKAVEFCECTEGRIIIAFNLQARK